MVAGTTYRRVEKHTEKTEVEDGEVRITSVGRVNNFVDDAIHWFLGDDDDHKACKSVKIMARGVAVAKAVIVSEILIRRVPGLKQAVELGSNDVEEEYEPVDDAEKDHVKQVRIVPYLVNTLTATKPLTKDDIKPDEFVERPDLAGDGGRRKGGGKGRGGKGKGGRGGPRSGGDRPRGKSGESNKNEKTKGGKSGGDNNVAA
ncbi:multidomain scavenger receptor protein PbSR precursor, putative [Perkinsus marinus ATCC 50983]|uniref:Multidomain scavenger receptor protein PbSR, putative n=1 Tax=Perkinsus marinus (strain ATCC 50983 / TXsc) TaxID=423536 RepID=C5L894_PERM5|nr:multidomain scavenger receptor protein PbSR precursor, putative [Perkinsus marinus ATCC 50983]EER07050.1 multidomain scavenger receptor protein PbSR precursor, putative [Perkinsus marinus ATCC 50983]|eukprot:XP_002775234.1 multidomain scavenger receptor protein PbSR precursor, putative [Perkinsus marinus ATCC 50983]